jgi:hypothetical protein
MSQEISSVPLARGDEGGWTLRRLMVIDHAAGVCVRCGMAGADTATRGWDAAERDVDELVAAHTRCVVGLGPPRAATTGRGYLLAA